MRPFSKRFSLDGNLYLLFTGMIFIGGSSSGRPFLTFLMGLVGIATASYFFFYKKIGLGDKLDRTLFILIFATILTSFIYIIPMPPFIWRSLSPSQSLIDKRDLLGLGQNYFALSLNFERSFYSLCHIFLFFGTYTYFLSSRSIIFNRFFKGCLILFALSIALATVQIGSNGNSFNFYDSSHRGVGLGFFANRNHYALFCSYALAFGLVFFSHLKLNTQNRLFLLIFLSVASFIMAVSTLSRVGILINVAIIGMFYKGSFVDLYKRHRGLSTAFLLSAISMVAWLSGTGKFGALLKRFGDTADDERWLIWERTAALISHAFPSGIGPGVFSQYYIFQEEVETVKSTYVNHAHNDLLELIIEFGAFSIPIITLGIYYMVKLILVLYSPAVQNKNELKIVGLVASLTILHSVVDYPLRTPAISILFAASLAYIHRSISKKATK